MDEIRSTLALSEAHVEGSESAAAISHPSAIEQVLRTTELLESVLLGLPLVDVLLAQMVSKQWQATIVGSLALQKALCFAPREKVRRKEKSLVYPEIQRYTDTLDRLSADDFLIEAARSRMTTANPLLTRLFQRYYGSEKAEFVYNRTSTSLTSTSHISSWRSMFISQPPATRATVTLLPPRLQKQGVFIVGLHATKREIYNASGITMADVVECIEGNWGMNGNFTGSFQVKTVFDANDWPPYDEGF